MEEMRNAHKSLVSKLDHMRPLAILSHKGRIYCNGSKRSQVRRDCMNVRFEVFTAVTTKNAVFWDVRPCGCSKNRRFGGT
jgi:hypothetical protein